MFKDISKTALILIYSFKFSLPFLTQGSEFRKDKSVFGKMLIIRKEHLSVIVMHISSNYRILQLILLKALMTIGEH